MKNEKQTNLLVLRTEIRPHLADQTKQFLIVQFRILLLGFLPDAVRVNQIRRGRSFRCVGILLLFALSLVLVLALSLLVVLALLLSLLLRCRSAVLCNFFDITLFVRSSKVIKLLVTVLACIPTIDIVSDVAETTENGISTKTKQRKK